MTYMVCMFTGDLGFTNDYSNVLQFDDRIARDVYFDNIQREYRIEISQTDQNRIFFDGGTLKLAFDFPKYQKTGFNPQFYGNCDFSHVTYLYLETEFLLNRTELEVPTVLHETKRTYYFVNSYRVVSSTENTTVIEFTLEYDYWMNNQFDFTFRESNVERSHVDRWDSDGKIVYEKPILDLIDTNMKTNEYIHKNPKSYNIYMGSSVEPNYQNVNIIWAVVTAIHTFGDNPDQVFYHIIPLKVPSTYPRIYEPTSIDYFVQFAVLVAGSGAGISTSVYNAPFQTLDNSALATFLGDGATIVWEDNLVTDHVSVKSIQILPYAPFDIVDTSITIGNETYEHANVVYYKGQKLTFIYNTTGSYLGEHVPFGSFCMSDLVLFRSSASEILYDNKIEFDYDKPVKPLPFTDNVETLYDGKYEPALYMNPVRKRYVVTPDVSSMCEIPDRYIIDKLNLKFTNENIDKITLHMKASLSSVSAFTYCTIGDYSRALGNQLGFAFIMIPYLWDIIDDNWRNYNVFQRNSDRQMMWTNIATGGISELGSTAVSAGIGYRSNMERSNALMNEVKGSNYIANFMNKEASDRYLSRIENVTLPNSKMYARMSRSAMGMSAIGGITAFSSNAIHQGMAQRTKERAIQNTPGTLVSAGNTAGTIMNNEFGIDYVELIADDTAYNQYKIMFMKYGYYIGSVMKPDIKSRKYFNYIKTNGAILTGSVNNLILSALASIFDNGVTIWHADYCIEYNENMVPTNHMYEYTKENIERSLITNG